MERKWLWMAVSAAALTGAALAGCGMQGEQQPEAPVGQLRQPFQPDGALTPATIGTVTQEFLSISEGTTTVTEETTVPRLVSPTWKADTSQAFEAVVEKAKADLAKKLGITAEEIAVIMVIGQEFSPDAFYCQASKGKISKEEPTAMISGETILLEAQGNRYEYHAAADSVTFCRRLN